MGSNSCMLFIEYTSVKSSVEMNKPMINFQCQLCTCIANANNAADSFSVGSEELSSEPCMNCCTMRRLARSVGWKASQKTYESRSAQRLETRVQRPMPLNLPCPQHASVEVSNPCALGSSMKSSWARLVFTPTNTSPPTSALSSFSIATSCGLYASAARCSSASHPPSRLCSASSAGTHPIGPTPVTSTRRAPSAWMCRSTCLYSERMYRM
uniref:Uncharacterized protein n=1 Tax=Oryza glumipatula TaxID=40148 RepID=A0A0D9Z038_9ORYZ